MGTSSGAITGLLFFNTCCTDARIGAVEVIKGFPPPTTTGFPLTGEYDWSRPIATRTSGADVSTSSPRTSSHRPHTRNSVPRRRSSPTRLEVTTHHQRSPTGPPTRSSIASSRATPHLRPRHRSWLWTIIPTSPWRPSVTRSQLTWLPRAARPRHHTRERARTKRNRARANLHWLNTASTLGQFRRPTWPNMTATWVIDSAPARPPTVSSEHVDRVRRGEAQSRRDTDTSTTILERLGHHRGRKHGQDRTAGERLHERDRVVRRPIEQHVTGE